MTSLKFDYLEELFEICQIKTNQDVSPRYAPHIPMRLCLNNRPPCQTLSNALDKSRKTPFTSDDAFPSNALKMSWVIEMSWFPHESPGV